MKRVFVDSNVFLRFFSGDEAQQREQASTLLRRATEGAVSLVSGPPVLFEVAWTLRAVYRQPRDTILDILAAIAAMPGLRLLDADLVDGAIALARRTGTDFADAYVVASASQAGADEIASFNREHFERLGARLASLETKPA